MDDISKIEELIEKSKKKQGKLKITDKNEAERLLESILKDPSKRLNGLDYMPSLPADTASNAFLKAWLSCNQEDREYLVNNLVKNRNFSSEAGYNRLIELIKIIVNESGYVAFRFLSAMSIRMTDSGVTKPADRQIKRFKTVLMDKRDLIKIPLKDINPGRIEANAIAVVVMSGLLLKGKEDGFKDMEWFGVFLDWLYNIHGKYKYKINQKIMSEFEKLTAEWPGELQQRCVEAGIVSLVTTRLWDRKDSTTIKELDEFSRQSIVNREQNLSNDQRDEGSKSRSDQDKSNKEKTKGISGQREDYTFNAKRYLSELTIYIENMESKQEKSLRLAQEKLLEINELKNRNSELENSLIGAQKGLNEMAAENKRMVANITGLKNTIEQVKRELAEKRRIMDEKDKSYEKDKESLLEMIDIQSNQVVVQVKNRLSMSLRTDYQDLKQIDGEQMTVDLGENLRIQLGNVFRLLEQEGIKF